MAGETQRTHRPRREDDGDKAQGSDRQGNDARNANAMPHGQLWVCHACGVKFKTQRELAEHEVEQHAAGQRGGGTEHKGQADSDTALQRGPSSQQPGAGGGPELAYGEPGYLAGEPNDLPGSRQGRELAEDEEDENR